MELDLGPEIAQFRAETRDWIASHAPAGLAELTDWNNVVTTGGYGSERRAEELCSFKAVAAFERGVRPREKRRQ